MDKHIRGLIIPHAIKYQGVTLTELIVTISIMAILLAIGTPGLQSMIVSNRLTSQTNMLLGALSYTRSEAIKRNKNVILTPTTASDWASGWMIFVDLNADTTFNADQEPELQRYDALHNGYSVRRVGFSNNPFDPDRVIYRPDGRTLGSCGINAGYFYISSPVNAADFREITIAYTGRVRVDAPQTQMGCN